MNPKPPPLLSLKPKVLWCIQLKQPCHPVFTCRLSLYGWVSWVHPLSNSQFTVRWTSTCFHYTPQ